MSAPVAPPVRAGDREREQTANQLGQALAQGYFALDEYETRLQATFAAHTTAELRELVADLPLDRIRRNDPARRQARRKAARRGVQIHLAGLPGDGRHRARPYGWSSASPRAPGISGRSGRSSGRASEFSAMRCRSGSRCPLDARRVRDRSGRGGSRSASGATSEGSSRPSRNQFGGLGHPAVGPRDIAVRAHQHRGGQLGIACTACTTSGRSISHRVGRHHHELALAQQFVQRACRRSRRRACGGPTMRWSPRDVRG